MVKPVTVRVDLLRERVTGECPACGFDALIRAHGYHLSPSGVTPLFDHIFCGRCRAEERRAQ